MPDVLTLTEAGRLRALHQVHGERALVEMCGVSRGRLERALGLRPIAAEALEKVRAYLDLAGELPVPRVVCGTCGGEVEGSRLRRTCDACLRAADLRRKRERARRCNARKRAPAPASAAPSRPAPRQTAALTPCPACGGPRGIDGPVLYCKQRRCEAGLAKLPGRGAS